MQRKLFRSMTALSVTASVFALLLLAAGPATAPTILPDARGVALANVDAAAAEPALDAVAEPALDTAADPVSAAARQRHQLHRARSLLALPYFSFAQGLRHGRS